MTAMTPYHGLDEYGHIKIRAGGSSPTVTAGSFVVVDSTNHGVIDASANGACCGISRTTSATADATVEVATAGVWKTLGTASNDLEPGDPFYIASSTTVKQVSTHGAKPQGIVVQTTTSAGATALYIMLIPSNLYYPSTYTTA